VRSCLLWLLAAPLVAAGTLGGHVLGYRVALTDSAEHAEVLAETGHGYLDHAPLAVGLCLALAAVALVLRGIAAARGASAATTPPWVFAMLPPAVYAVQEHLERLLHSGHAEWTHALEPPFLVGLVFQLPFAVAALLLARALATMADAIGRAFVGGSRRPRLSSVAVLARPAVAALPRVRASALAYGERGPPSLG
jgi:hypothetical protein